MKFAIYWVCFISFLTVRCTMEKRLYNRGYHIEWKKKVHSNSEDVTQEKNKNRKQDQLTPVAFTPLDSVIELKQEKNRPKNSVALISETQDLVMKNTEEVLFPSSDNQNKTITKKIRKDDSDQSREVNDEKELAKKKNAAIFFSILGFIILTATILGFFWVIVTVDTYLILFLLFLLLCSGVVGCVLLFFAITLWDSYRDAKKLKTIYEDPTETLDEPKSKRSGWVYLAFVGLIIGALILNNFSKG